MVWLDKVSGHFHRWRSTATFQGSAFTGVYCFFCKRRTCEAFHNFTLRRKDEEVDGAESLLEILQGPVLNGGLEDVMSWKRDIMVLSCSFIEVSILVGSSEVYGGNGAAGESHFLAWEAAMVTIVSFSGKSKHSIKMERICKGMTRCPPEKKEKVQSGRKPK